MAMFVKKWKEFLRLCADIKEKRRDIRATRQKITVFCQKMDYNTERPTGCFVRYNTVAFPWWTESHPAKDVEFVSVCPEIGEYGLCHGGDDECPMFADYVHYCWAMSDLEHLKEMRRDSLRDLLGLKRNIKNKGN